MFFSQQYGPTGAQIPQIITVIVSIELYMKRTNESLQTNFSIVQRYLSDPVILEVKIMDHHALNLVHFLRTLKRS